MTIEIGSTIPSEIPLFHLPPAIEGACSFAPEKIYLNKIDKPYVIVVVPGAFTPTCSERHIPAYLTTSSINLLKEKGIKQVLILSVDSPFITRAWGDSLVNDKKEIKDELSNGYIKFISDAGAEWLSSLGLVGEPNDVFAKNGLRGLRSAIIVNKDGKIDYLGIDTQKGVVEKSGIEGVLKALD